MSKKVFFFLTTHIKASPDYRFAKAGTKSWDFFPEDNRVFYKRHLDEVLSELEATSPEAFKAVKEVCIEVHSCPENEDPSDRNPDYRSYKGCHWAEFQEYERKLLFLDYDFSRNKVLEEIVNKRFDEFKNSEAEKARWKLWKDLYYIEKKETGNVYCALYDYNKDNYKEEFLKYIFDKLPECFEADEYFLFIHGSSLIKDNHGDAIVYPKKEAPFGLKCPDNFRIKTFHHQLCYDEYCFLINPELDDLSLELPFENEDAKNVILGLEKWLNGLLEDPVSFEPTGNPFRTYLELTGGDFAAKYDKEFTGNQQFKERNLCEWTEPESVRQMKPEERLELATEIYKRSHVLKLKLGWK